MLTSIFRSVTCTLFATTGCLFVLLLTGPALAADGVDEINQTSALAGGITPGDAAGFPITLTEPGSYVLTSNLSVPAGTSGIDVGAPGVTP